MEQVLETLEKAQLHVKLSKCEFERLELKFLGHIVGADGIKPDPAKVQVLKDWPQPGNVSELRSFIGLATYFRKFVQGYANLVAPLTHLTKMGVPYVWSPECEQAFVSTKPRWRQHLCCECLILSCRSNSFRTHQGMGLDPSCCRKDTQWPLRADV